MSQRYPILLFYELEPHFLERERESDNKMRLAFYF
jgi:hypothetical protein